MTNWSKEKGKNLQLQVRFKNDSRAYFYHGEILDAYGDKVWIDDMILGRIWFFNNQIVNSRELEYHDLLKLAPKSDRARTKLKLMQAEMKAGDTVKNIVNKLKGG